MPLQCSLNTRSIFNLKSFFASVMTGDLSLIVPFEIVEGRWKETSLFICSYRQGIPAGEVYWSATLSDGTRIENPPFTTQDFVTENQTDLDVCHLEATSQFYYAFDMSYNGSRICCNVKQEEDVYSACDDVYVLEGGYLVRFSRWSKP